MVSCFFRRFRYSFQFDNFSPELLRGLFQHKLVIPLESDMTESQFMDLMSRSGINSHQEDIRKNLFEAYSSGHLKTVIIQGKLITTGKCTRVIIYSFIYKYEEIT